MGGEHQAEWSKKPHGEEVTLPSSGSNELLAHGVLKENSELFFIGGFG